MKTTVKQMLIFSVIVNGIGWILMIVANFAFPETFRSEAMGLICFGWPVLAGIAYVAFDLMLGLDGNSYFSERFAESLVKGVLWVIVSVVFMYLAIGIAVLGLQYTQESTEAWNQSYGVAYGVMGGFLMVGVTFGMAVWFGIRSVYYLLKDKGIL